MNKRLSALAVTGLIIIFFMTSVNALQVNDIANNLETNTNEITSLKQEVNNKFSIIENKLDNYATKQDITDLLTAHLFKVNEIMDVFRSLLIVSITMIGLSLLGLGYSIYFYFKGKGRL